MTSFVLKSIVNRKEWRVFCRSFSWILGRFYTFHVTLPWIFRVGKSYWREVLLTIKYSFALSYLNIYGYIEWIVFIRILNKIVHTKNLHVTPDPKEVIVVNMDLTYNATATATRWSLNMNKSSGSGRSLFIYYISLPFFTSQQRKMTNFPVFRRIAYQFRTSIWKISTLIL